MPSAKLTGIFIHDSIAECGINNPSVDLSVIWSFYPSCCHERFFGIYGEVDAPIWQYARFLGLYSAFTLIFYGHSTGDALLIAEATDAIRRINERLLV